MRLHSKKKNSKTRHFKRQTGGVGELLHAAMNGNLPLSKILHLLLKSLQTL